MNLYLKSTFLVSISLMLIACSGIKKNSSNQENNSSVSPITEEIKAQADNYLYNFDPTKVHFTINDHEQLNSKYIGTENYPFDFSNTSDIYSLPTNGEREGFNLVYKFEGSYVVGWVGSFIEAYSTLFLWEDGKFAGTSGEKEYRGYWHDNGDGSTLALVTSNNPDDWIIATKQSGFYGWFIDLISSLDNGLRIKTYGYLYYPDVALFIDTGDFDSSKVKVGDNIDIFDWRAKRVIKNLQYSTCYENDTDKVSWKVNGFNISESIIKITEAGNYDVTATWKELQAHCVFVVV